MAAPDVELANAIVADMNATARNWTQYFRAERTWTPLWIGKDQLGDLQCIVNPWPIAEVESLSRDSTSSTYSIDFGFAKRLDDQTIEEIDNLRLLVDVAYKRYAKTNYTVANVGTFIALRRLDEYVTFDPSRLDRSKDGNTTNYTGDFLSVFRVPYLLKAPL
tara:strand:+ start:1403 stop:1888 length:486 start_codon:yes stop_codon:yes gene_type:complete